MAENSYCSLLTLVEHIFDEVPNKWMSTYPLVYVYVTSNTTLFGSVDAHFCTFGFSFIFATISGYLLAVLGVGCLLWIQIRFRSIGSHVHRKLLFALLGAVGTIRGVFNTVATQKVSQAALRAGTIIPPPSNGPAPV